MGIPSIIVFIVSLVVLLMAAKFLTESGVRVAKRMGVSEFMIGLTIISISTSLPELFAGIFAALNGQTELIIGDVIGSNIANIGLVLGLGTVLIAVETTRNHYRRDGLFMLFVTLLFILFSLNGTISFVEGIIFLSLFVLYIFFIYKSRDEDNFHFGLYLNRLYHVRGILTFENYKLFFRKIRKKIPSRRFQIETTERSLLIQIVSFKIFKDILIVLLSGFVMSYAAILLVNSSVELAGFLGISTILIGTTFIAIGTSLPELGVTIMSAKKGLHKILLGNIIGSNISNILLILGVSSLISPLEIPRLSLVFMIPALLVMTFLLVIFIKSHWLKRAFEGILLLILYLLFLYFLVFWIRV